MKRRTTWKTCWLCLVALAGLAAARGAVTDIRIERLPEGIRYGVMGARAAQPAPAIVMLQGSLESVLAEPLFTETARILVRRGWVAVILEAPAHGEDARPGEAKELAAWSDRIDAGEDLIGPFVDRARKVLDALVRDGLVDPRRLAVAGTSRGGFLAFHLAAAEPRFRCVGGIAPVTDLRQLREFKACAHPEKAADLAVARLAPRLAGRPAWISIGNRDDRVGTDAAIACARALVAASGENAPVELRVHTGAGHRSTVRDHELLAAWVEAQFAAP